MTARIGSDEEITVDEMPLILVLIRLIRGIWMNKRFISLAPLKGFQL